MHFPKDPSSLFLLLITALFVSTTTAQTTIYVDSANNNRKADGTQNNPFPTLQQGLTLLSKYVASPTDTSYILMIAASGADYDIEVSNFQIANFGGTITITSSSPITSPASVSDCEKLASINFGAGGLSFSGITNLYLSKLNFVEVPQSLKVSESSLFQFTDSCVQDQIGHSKSFFKNYNVTRFLFRNNMIFAQLNGEFMTYIHQKIDSSKSSELNKLAELSNNVIVLKPNSQTSRTTSFMNFESSGSGQFSWNNNTIQGENSTVYFGTSLLTVTAFKNTNINGLKLSQQTLTFTSFPMININSSPNVTLESWELSGNLINFSPSVQFVLSTDNTNLTVNNLDYNFNTISATSNSSAILQFLSVNQINNMFFNNHTIDNNRFYSSFIFFTQPPTNFTCSSIKISNITFTSNFNPAEDPESTSTFTYLSQLKLVLASFTVQDLTYSNNTMAGSLFQLSLSAHSYQTPVILSFTRCSVVDNPNAVDFCFVEVVNNNPYGSKPMYHHDFEYYFLKLTQLSVQNNVLIKGDDKVLFYHIGFIQSFGAQVHLVLSTITDNTFKNYDVVDMISQMASAFVVNSNIANNVFNNSALVNTEYGVLQVYGDYYSFLTGIRIVYRYAMVINSRFNNLTLINSTLFTLNNPYLTMRGNTFNNITFNHSNMLVGANFAPPGATLGVSNYIRNTTAESLTLRSIPILYALFTSGLKQIKSLTGDDTVYFYSLELNTFKNLTFYNGGLMSFTKYSFKGSIISLNNNTFLDIQLMDDTNYLVQTNGPYLFAFTKNFMINIKGFGSQLNLDSMSESKGCYIKNNTIDGVNGPGVIKGKGSSLHDFNISHNNFTNNVFKASVIDISVTSIYGEFLYYENIFENNSLILRNDTFFQSYNFIMLTAQISYSQYPISLSSSLFNNITVVENPNSIKHGYIYGVMTFFVANSSIVLKHLNFTDIDFQGQEITLIYASSSGFQLSDSTISGVKADNTYGFLTLYSHNLYISGNLFYNMVNSREYGYGIVYLPGAPDQTFYINVTLVENTFTACSASQGALVGTEVNTLNLTILKTTVIGSSEYIGAVTLRNTTCFGCNITDMDIVVNGVSGYTNDTFFYFTQVIGQIAISDINLNLKYDITKIPTYYREYLFLIDQSSQLFIDIYDIRMTSETSWAPWIQFINMTTAQVTFRDSVIANLTSWQSFIQIEGPSSFGKSTFNMTNVTVYNMTFRTKIPDQEIGFLFYNNSNSADSSLISSADTLIQDSRFLFVDGGVIASYFAPMKYNINVTNSSFVNNTDNEGTALFYHLNSRSSESTLYVDKCYFYNNTATTVGGVMSFYSLNFQITNSQFVNNSAVKNGGALFVLGKRPTSLLANNFFFNNTSPYQKDIGIAPETLYITTNFSKDLGIYESKTLPTTGKVNIDSVSPEVLKELQFFVIDASTYAFSSAKIILVLQDNEANQAYDFSQQSLTITFQNQGTSYSTDCNYTTCILKDFSISFVGNEGDIIPVEVGYSSEAFQIPVKKFGLVLRRCVAGEFFNSVNQICERCEVNTYSFLTTEPCKDCVKNAICAGGSSICPNEGYWSHPENATKIYSCKTDGVYRCKGGCNGCEDGYTGPLCQACNFTEGYVETGSFQCSTCKSPLLSLAISLGISLSFIGIVIFGAYSTYETNSSFFTNTDYKQTKQQIKKSYFLRLLSRYIQIFSFIYYSSTYFQSLVGQASRLGQTVSRTITYASQCSLIAIGLEPSQYIYVITVLNIMIPFCELFILFILANFLFNRKIIRSKYRFMLTAIVSVVTWHQATLVGFMSDKMSCTTLYKDSGASYLSLHSNWRCDESPYPEFKTNLIIPNLVFWAVVIPITLSIVFIINRKNLDEETFGTALGGLYDYLKREYFFWSVIQMVVDVTLGMCTYLLAQNPEIRVFVTVIILWVYQMLVRWFTPYKLPYLNRIEITAINVCILNILLMYSLVDSKYDILRYTAITLIISTNFSVFALLLLRLGRLFIPEWLYLLLRSMFRIGKGRASVTPVNTAEEDLIQMTSESEAENTRLQVEATIKARARGSTTNSQSAGLKQRNESLRPDTFSNLKKPSFEMTRSVTHANVVIRRSSSGTVL